MALSESARAISAHEASFRSHYAQSTGRWASLIALDPASEAVVAHAVAALPDRRRAIALSGGEPGADWIATLQARAIALLDDAARADLVVMIATAGADAQAGALFGEACRLRGVPVTALVIASLDTPDAMLSHTLAPLRPIASMLVVAQDADYVHDMLQALRA